MTSLRSGHGALVLAGGGIAGIAWELGVILGIADAAPDLAARILQPSTALVGTSAGSVVASAIAGGVSLEELYAEQLGAAASDDTQTQEDTDLGALFDPVEFGTAMADAVAGAHTPGDVRRRIGAVALAAKTVDAASRRAVMVARLPVHTWPERDLLVTAVDAETGERRAFDRTSGVDLIDAVGASCAVPGIWPVVEINGRRYMDGGVHSIANVDLAAGADRVLVVLPTGEQTARETFAVPQAELDAVAPARVHIVYADTASVGAFGPNPLDPAVRSASAAAGREQGRRVAGEVERFWD